MSEDVIEGRTDMVSSRSSMSNFKRGVKCLVYRKLYDVYIGKFIIRFIENIYKNTNLKSERSIKTKWKINKQLIL